MHPKICHECLRPTEKLWDYKGTPVCPDCYHKHHGSKKFINDNRKPFIDRKPTVNDLKNYLEKKW